MTGWSGFQNLWHDFGASGTATPVQLTGYKTITEYYPNSQSTGVRAYNFTSIGMSSGTSLSFLLVTNVPLSTGYVDSSGWLAGTDGGNNTATGTVIYKALDNNKYYYYTGNNVGSLVTGIKTEGVYPSTSWTDFGDGTQAIELVGVVLYDGQYRNFGTVWTNSSNGGNPPDKYTGVYGSTVYYDGAIFINSIAVAETPYRTTCSTGSGADRVKLVASGLNIGDKVFKTASSNDGGSNWTPDNDRYSGTFSDNNYVNLYTVSSADGYTITAIDPCTPYN